MFEPHCHAHICAQIRARTLARLMEASIERGDWWYMCSMELLLSDAIGLADVVVSEMRRVGAGPSSSKLSSIWIILWRRDNVTSDWRCLECLDLPKRTSMARK